MQFNVSFDVGGSPDLGSLTASEQQAILDTANAAATIWSWYLTPANVTLSLSLTIDNSAFSGTVLAQGGPALFYSTGSTFNGRRVYDTNTAIELRTGQDRNGAVADLEMILTVNSIRNLLVFKTDDSASVTWNRCDALSVFLHEIGHGLGFSSFDGDTSAASVYDTFIQNGVFTGSNAEQAAGMPAGVPLESGDNSHVAESGVLASDLMSPKLNRGTNLHISSLDLAMLKDIGVPIRQASSGADVMHALYGASLYLGAGNDTGYAVAGGSTVYGEGGDDQLYGGKQRDFLYGGDGDDYLEGGAGNDAIDGGAGRDKAIFSRNYASYAIVDNGGGSLTVTGADGADTLAGIEQLIFADRVYNAGGFALTNNKPRSDLNNDGKSDLIWQNENGQAGVWLMDGTTILSNPYIGTSTSLAWHVIGSGDFDGDGKVDLLWQSSAGQAGIWFMDGATVRANPPAGSNPGTEWHVIAAADMDGNGKSDIVWQHDNGQAGVWLMDGQTMMANPKIGITPNSAWHVAAAGDLNGDGKADLVWRSDFGQIGVWFMNGESIIDSPVLGATLDISWKLIATGDFDGDRQADLLWQNSDGKAAIWLMNGATVTSTSMLANPGSEWLCKGASDLNGDGMADILWQNVSGQAGAWMMSGSSILAQHNLGANPGSSWHLVASSSG